MSAFGGKADISGRHQMSAFDPKRTLSFIALTRVRHFGGRLARGQGEPDVGRRDAAVVSVDGGGSVVRGGRYPLYPRISGTQMGVPAGDRVYWRRWCICIRPWLCHRLDDFPSLVHARHGRRLLQARTDQYIRTRTVVDESADGGNGADNDDTQSAYPVRKRSHETELLVCNVDGPSGRIRHKLSDQLVASGEPSQTRHDDRAPGERGCRCTRSRCSRLRPRGPWRPLRHDYVHD